jgi:hypothetical protein
MAVLFVMQAPLSNLHFDNCTNNFPLLKWPETMTSLASRLRTSFRSTGTGPDVEFVVLGLKLNVVMNLKEHPPICMPFLTKQRAHCASPGKTVYSVDDVLPAIAINECRS